MQAWLLIILLTVSCARYQVREPSAVTTDYFYDEISTEKSLVKLFPPEFKDGSYHNYLFLQLKNARGEFVDCDPLLLDLRLEKASRPSFAIERFARGRYYLTLQSKAKIVPEQLDILLDGKVLKEQIELLLRQPDPKYSNIKILHQDSNKLRLQLFLSDSKGAALQLVGSPDLIIEGHCLIQNLEEVKLGHWEFDLLLPEQNEIIYISVRAQGSFLERLFRFQHIEK